MKKKVIVACTVAGILLFSGVTVFAVKSSSQKKVTVVPVMELMNNGGGMNHMNLSGMITSDVSQQIYLKDGQTVKEVYVKEGDTVKVGDKLVAFDMTLENLNLEMKKLDRQTLELNIQKAQRRLEELKNSHSSGSDSIPEPEEPQQEQPQTPQDVQAARILDDQSKEYMGTGTPEDPSHYLVSQEGVIKGSFLNARAKDHKFFVVEVREGDVSSGKLIQYWGQVAYKEGFYVDPNQEYNLNLQSKETHENEKVIPPYELLTRAQVEESGWVSGDGTSKNPYVFLVKKAGAVEGSFFRKMKEMKVYFRIEVRSDDQNNGILLQAWEQNGEWLEEVADQDRFFVQIQKEVQEKPDVKPDPSVPVEPQPPVQPEPPVQPPTQPQEEGTKVPDPPKDTEGEISNPVPTNPEENVSQTSYFGTGWALQNKKESAPLWQYKTVADVMTGSDEVASAENEIRTLKLDLKEADLELKKMERDLKRQVIKSNINGVVKKIGDTEKPSQDGSPMIFVAGSEGLYVKGNVSEMQLDQVQAGTVLMGYSYDSGVNFTAEVQEVSPYPSQGENGGSGNTSVYPFTAYIEQAEGLKNYSWAELSVDGSQNMTGDAFVIEKPFVRSENGKYYVMIDNGKGKLKKQPVTVSKIVSGYAYEITEGLSMEDKISFPYGKNVKQGAKTQEGSLEDLYH